MDNNYDFEKFPDWYFDAYSFDWFLCDPYGQLACLTAASYSVPKSIRTATPKKYQKLQAYINSLPIISEEIILSEFIKKNINNLKVYSNPSLFISVYSYYAVRGIYAFNDAHNTSYNLIAKPKKSLHISSLPSEFAQIINKTKLKANLSDTLILDVNELE
jgi:hypothetical protein